MRIGILTFHCADNFGAVLQAYALQKTVKKQGFECEIINFQPDCLIDPYSAKIGICTSIRKIGFCKKSIRQIISRIIHYNSNIRRKQNFEDFRVNYLTISSKKYYKYEDLLQDPPFFDVYIVGSDQVWNPDFIEKTGNAYFLTFAPEKSKKIAYASSISNQSLNNMDHLYLEEISKFNWISVREYSAKVILSELISNQIIVTLDPTLLLDSAEWECISSHIEFKYKYILVYDLIKNEEIIKLANRVAEKLDYKIISYSNKDAYHNWVRSFSNSHPSEFISLFMKAQFIITNSFHGTVFSIIFKKDFFTIPHPTRGDRMINLLNSLKLSDRIITAQSEITKLIIENIDYPQVFGLLDEQKDVSLRFLKEAIIY